PGLLPPPRPLVAHTPPPTTGALRRATAPHQPRPRYPPPAQDPPRLVAGAPRTSIPVQPQDARPVRPERPRPNLRQHPPRSPLRLPARARLLPARARHRPPRPLGRTTILTSLIRLISPTRLIQAPADLRSRQAERRDHEPRQDRRQNLRRGWSGPEFVLTHKPPDPPDRLCADGGICTLRPCWASSRWRVGASVGPAGGRAA